MNYYIEWQLYTSTDLLSRWEKKEILLFDWFYVSNDWEWLNIFKSPLKNYFKHNFTFYFSSDNIKHLLWDERKIKAFIQDNIELELGFYCLLNGISLISWIYTWIKEYQEIDKIFHKLNYIINDKYCWNYHKQNNNVAIKNSSNYFWYKFRLSNLEITPSIDSNIKINDYMEYFGQKMKLDLKDEDLITQLHYYNNRLFLENQWFISDAFNYLYKIIEIEERKIWNENIVNKDELENKIREFIDTNNKITINIDNFCSKIKELKLVKSKEIREEIFTKYNLEWDLKDFQKLSQIRWKFSHAWDIDYVYLGDFHKWKKFTFEIILKKITQKKWPRVQPKPIFVSLYILYGRKCETRTHNPTLPKRVR